MPTYDDLKARNQASCSGDCKVSRPGIRRRLERAWAREPRWIAGRDRTVFLIRAST